MGISICTADRSSAAVPVGGTPAEIVTGRSYGNRLVRRLTADEQRGAVPLSVRLADRQVGAQNAEYKACRTERVDKVLRCALSGSRDAHLSQHAAVVGADVFFDQASVVIESEDVCQVPHASRLNGFAGPIVWI